MSIYILKSAKEYAANHAVEEWIHLFLRGEGDNEGLSEGLKLRQRYWVGPIEVQTAVLDRVVGPEPDREYVENEVWWNQNIGQIAERLEDGWDMPPLIVENRNGLLSVRDGNHRLGALQKLKRETCHVIIWDDNGEEAIMNALGQNNERKRQLG